MRQVATTAMGRRRGTATYLVCVGILALLFISPLIWAVLRSFQPANLITSVPTSKDFTDMSLGNYRGLLTGANDVLRNVLNSLGVASATAITTALVATLAGYGFGRFRFRGSGIVFALILVTLMVPFQAVLVPLFLELHYFHLTNSLVGLTLFYVTFNLPFGVFIMRNTFLQIPSELVDSARVDGAGTITALLRVYRPLIAPGVATALLYAFLFAWTEFLGALTFLTSPHLYTLPLALLGIELGTYGQVNFGYLVAGAVISMVPCVVLYVALQRYYVQGLVSGAVKG